MTIKINALRMQAFHGVLEQERKVGNLFEINLTVLIEVKESAFIGDKIDGTANYALITDIIRQEMSIPSSLLENVAYRIKNAVSDAFPNISHGEVSIAKLLPPIKNLELQSVEVKLCW